MSVNTICEPVVVHSSSSNYNSPAYERVESCYMSWFLVAVQNGPTPSTGHVSTLATKHTYCIIHRVDIAEEDAEDMYIQGLVNFWQHKTKFRGRLLLASENRLAVERHQQMLMARNTAMKDEPNCVLVQYSKAHRLIHALVHKADVVWPGDDHSGSKSEVVFRDGDKHRLARVLYVGNQEQQALDQFEELRTRCRALVRFDYVPRDAEPWLLVQYSCSHHKSVYAIVHYSKTQWRMENDYEDVVAYLQDGDVVFQAIILNKSLDLKTLESALQNIKQSCAMLKFPLVHSE